MRVMQSAIGQRIRKLRKQHNPPWSMNRLAIQAEIDAGQLSRAERGLAGIPISKLARIATLLNTSLAELVDPKHSSAQTHVDSIEVLVQNSIENIWKTLDSHQLKQCSHAELNLIRHHIRSAIEEGMNRGEIQAERELHLILRQSKPLDEQLSTNGRAR